MAACDATDDDTAPSDGDPFSSSAVTSHQVRAYFQRGDVPRALLETDHALRRGAARGDLPTKSARSSYFRSTPMAAAASMRVGTAALALVLAAAVFGTVGADQSGKSQADFGSTAFRGRMQNPATMGAWLPIVCAQTRIRVSWPPSGGQVKIWSAIPWMTPIHMLGCAV